MENIKTYPVGNGEIELTESDADELRILLQFDYLRKITQKIIVEHKNDFNHLTPTQYERLLDEMERINSDFVHYDSSYFAENILENALRIAERYKPNK